MINCWVFWSRKRDQIWKKRRRGLFWKELPTRNNCLRLSKRFCRCFPPIRTFWWTVKPSTFWPLQKSSQHKSSRNNKSLPSPKNQLTRLVNSTNQYHNKRLVCSSPFQTWATSTLCISTHSPITLNCSLNRFWRATSHPTYQSDSKTSRHTFCTHCIRTFVDPYSKKTNFCYPSY